MTVKDFNRRLKTSGITAMDVAALLSISRSTISKWRARRKIPRAYHMLLQQVLELDQRSLLSRLRRHTERSFQ